MSQVVNSRDSPDEVHGEMFDLSLTSPRIALSITCLPVGDVASTLDYSGCSFLDQVTPDSREMVMGRVISCPPASHNLFYLTSTKTEKLHYYGEYSLCQCKPV